MTHDKLIEAMARAIWNTRGFAHSSDDRMFEPLEYGEEGEYAPLQAECRDAARAGLAVVLDQVRALEAENARLREALAELKVLAEEYNPKNSDWRFRKTVIAEICARDALGGDNG